VTRPRGVVWAAVAVAAVGVTAGIVWVAVETRTAEPPVSLNGPLQQVPAHGWIAVVRPGATITDAQEILYNRGDAPVTITDIEVLGGSNSLLYLGALVAGPAAPVRSRSNSPSTRRQHTRSGVSHDPPSARFSSPRPRVGFPDTSY
jgi:hypothetical protein